MSVFFFDGVCGLCNHNVNFILRRDKKKIFKFVALQDDKAKKFFKDRGMPEPDFSTSVLFHNEKFFYKSDVYFELARELGLPWSLAAILKIIPKFLRNKVYDLIAANRYKIFGTLETCRVPTSEEKERFL